MKRRSLLLTSLVVTGLALVGGGCLGVVVAGGAAAGAGTIAYMRGTLQSYEPYPLAPTFDASLKGLADMGLAITRTDRGAAKTTIVARTGEDIKVSVILREASAQVTQIRIHVGVWGDEKMSREVLGKIRAHYAAQPKAQTGEPMFPWTR